ncbi:MAG: endonuclease-8 [Acidimicrobiales bacterium]|jgi:endonuclease-8
MPEGHVLHRAARLQGKRFNKKVVSMRSPQGRFADSADHLDGLRLDTIEAKGKHLFYRFGTGDVLHVHLGLFGKFRMATPPFPEPSDACRVLMWTAEDELHLAGPTTCEILDPDGMVDVLARLGPDPIQKPADGADQLAARLSRRKIPIGRALMDQGIISGIGNVYRSELLFMIGLDPFTPANEVDRAKIDELWNLTVVELKAGERLGRIVTVAEVDAGGTKRGKLPPGERLYAYKRGGDQCRRCGDLVRSADIDGRNVWWCPRCQP